MIGESRNSSDLFANVGVEAMKGPGYNCVKEVLTAPETTPVAENVQYKFLQPKLGSNYRQLFVGRIRAEILYRETVGTEPLTPEQVASEYGVPVDAVLEAIDYSIRNKALLDQERASEAVRIKAAGRDRWPYVPRNFEPRE